jgi:hypothetical protein
VGNGVKDAGERCCGLADRVAFLDELGATFLENAERSLCVPSSQAGSFDALGTGAKWCTTGTAACTPGCRVPLTWTNPVVRSQLDYSLDVTATIGPFTMPVVGQVHGVDSTCALSLTANGTQSLHFGVADDGTRLTLETKSVDVSLHGYDFSGCPLFTNMPDVPSQIANSIESQMAINVPVVLSSMEHACAY